ncbi:hypothetical protein I317_04223 [Kwoniella heveanensis CBS 569]|nr:hypothetical protein I317_04223 [Kwoniella heveanensis CBS 569]
MPASASASAASKASKTSSATAAAVAPSSTSASNGPSPLISNRSPLSQAGTVKPAPSSGTAAAANLDLSLNTAVIHLVQHLIQPLSAHYSHATLLSLRDELSSRLTRLFQPTWETTKPTQGSGSRSLICSKSLGLPNVLRESAGQVGVEVGKWRKALASCKTGERGEEWQAWCDPGQVVWRWGGWEWEDVGFEPFKVIKEPFQIIWQASSSSPSLSPQTPNAAPIHTPARASHAIPIRAPSAYQPVGPLTPGPTGQPPVVVAIPPTPGPASQASIFPSPSPDPNDGKVEDKHELDSSFARLGLGPAPIFGGPKNVVPSGWTSSDAGSRSTSMAESYLDESRSVSASSFISMRSDDQNSDMGHGLDEHNEESRSKATSRASHRGSESTSSVASSVSDSNSGHTQLLTPASRPNSADPFTVPSLSLLKERKDDKDRLRKTTPPSSQQALGSGRGRTPSPNSGPNGSVSDGQAITPGTETTIGPSPSATATSVSTPTVTPYDGGNVTVLGGGVKLGGSSRPSSVLSSRSSHDRSRSPSISLASRALNTAVGPNSNSDGSSTSSGSSGLPRKQRTRRRIMPTYLGHLGQPGVGGPVMGVFGQFAGAGAATTTASGTGQKTPSTPFGGPGHVGVGVSPPVVGRVPVPMPRMG